MLRSPAGALVLFLIGLGLLLVLVSSRGGSTESKTESSSRKAPNGQQISQSVEREITPFRPGSTPAQPAHSTALPVAPSAPPKLELPPLSLVAESPGVEVAESTISEKFIPFGRLIPCELIITVDSSAIQTPIVGLVTEDIFITACL